jgi:hypothetical protein
MESKGIIESISLKNSASLMPNNMTSNHDYFAYVSNIDEPTINIVKLKITRGKSSFEEASVGNKDNIAIYGIKYIELEGVSYLVTCF